MAPKYKRVLLKLSGESLAGKAGHGIDFDTVLAICKPVKELVDMGVEVAIVVGGGNFWRGRSSGEMERTCADKIGMLATVMNCLALADALRQTGVPAVVQSAIVMPQIAATYTRDDAVQAMEEGKVVLFGGGTACPFFSTDTSSALRAIETGCDVMFKATMVDGVYDKDPKKYPDAVKYSTLTFSEVLEKKLGVMDGTAATLCRENGLPILVFDLAHPANIARAVKGEDIGTLVQEA